MKLRVYLSLFSALAILTVSTGCIISHCTTPPPGAAPSPPPPPPRRAAPPPLPSARGWSRN